MKLVNIKNLQKALAGLYDKICGDLSDGLNVKADKMDETELQTMLNEVFTTDIDVIGYVDDNNNIVLSGTLANGTYNLRYRMEDETYCDLGTVVLSAVTEGNLFNLETTKINIRYSGSSAAEKAQNGVWLTDLIPLDIATANTIYVKNAIMSREVGTAPSPVVSFFDENGAYLGNIQCNPSYSANYIQYTEVISDQYTRINLDVAKTLNGNDAWWPNIKYMRIAGVEDESGAAITKDMITDVIITINKPIGTTAVNLIPTAMAENLDGIFNSVGYKENIRWSGTNQAFVAANDNAPCVVTGLIPLGEDGDVLHIRGVDTIAYVENYHSGYYHCYDASGARLQMGTAIPTSTCMSTDENGDITLTLDHSKFNLPAGTAYISLQIGAKTGELIIMRNTLIP